MHGTTPCQKQKTKRSREIADLTKTFYYIIIMYALHYYYYYTARRPHGTHTHMNIYFYIPAAQNRGKRKISSCLTWYTDKIKFVIYQKSKIYTYIPSELSFQCIYYYRPVSVVCVRCPRYIIILYTGYAVSRRFAISVIITFNNLHGFYITGFFFPRT